jgi:copper(I)-binding protein
MLEQLAAPLVEDRRFTVTLTLASGRTLEVHVVVATNAPR